MTENQAIAALLLRLLVGGFQIPHGLQKFGLIGGNVDLARASFAEYGLHPPAAWVRAVGGLQLLFGVLVVVGFVTTGAALVTGCLSLGMANVALRRNGWFWQHHGVEYAVFWAVSAACLALMGPGPWSVDGLWWGGAP